MDNVPYDGDSYEPSEQDWAEYAAWSRGQDHRTECCEAHNWQDPNTPCPDCQDDWDSTWALGEGPDADPTADWWYRDLLMMASLGEYDPHCGWRAEQ